MNEIANLIDRKQAAQMLGVTVATIDQLVKLELLQSHKIGSHRVFSRQFIQDFMKSWKRQPAISMSSSAKASLGKTTLSNDL